MSRGSCEAVCVECGVIQAGQLHANERGPGEDRFAVIVHCRDCQTVTWFMIDRVTFWELSRTAQPSPKLPFP